MPATVVVGGFYGDEGKGKIISYLALSRNYEIGVRGGVGPNAGHTVIHMGKTFKLRMLPSAVVNEKTRLMVGAGVLVDAQVLKGEINKYSASSRVLVDWQCALIEQSHVLQDRSEHLKDKIGTTGTGTGPANADRIMRRAKLVRDAQELSEIAGDVADEVNASLDSGGNVLVEGTQGTFLSLYHGSYPYVTSKDVTASAICSDVGIGPKRVDDVLVVFKAFVTRVGKGPLDDELGAEEVKRRGWSEFGTVTGRPRRAAPFDFRLARRAIMLNGATSIALTKLDTVFAECKGIYEFDKLSKKARAFVEEVESELGVKVSLIGTGPDLSDIVDRQAE